MALFKTLVFTDEKEIFAFGKYVRIIDESNLGGCEIPELMSLEANMRKLKKMYPKQDFKGVDILTVKVSEIETTKS